VVVVGIGADGWPGLSERLRTLVSNADVVLGGRRHLSLLPPHDGQVRESWPSPLRDSLPALLARHADHRVVALASGDPLLSGVGTALVDLLGTDRVRIEPSVSSVTLARARLGWSAESVEVVTLVGRDVDVVRRHLAPGHRLLLLSSDADTPAKIARLLADAGYGDTNVVVLGNLGGAEETRVEERAGWWSADVPALNVVALELVGPVVGSWLAGLPDTAYEHDGQLTKRDLRASALARLAPQPGQLLWDVGAGAGSVGIEWMRAHPRCRVVAVEVNRDRADRISRNAARLGVPGLRVVCGRAPEALHDLPRPAAVFVGGGATQPRVVEACRRALPPGGRLVVHGVTLETEALLVRAYDDFGGELTRHSVDRAAGLGDLTGWSPSRPVMQWAWTKGDS
jgi:precorrin-6B C5,15-methyltransferase / cobalt-precorrin-6B C5,C15-methyltransferase